MKNILIKLAIALIGATPPRGSKFSNVVTLLSKSLLRSLPDNVRKFCAACIQATLNYITDRSLQNFKNLVENILTIVENWLSRAPAPAHVLYLINKCALTLGSNSVFYRVLSLVFKKCNIDFQKNLEKSVIDIEKNSTFDEHQFRYDMLKLLYQEISLRMEQERQFLDSIQAKKWKLESSNNETIII